MTFKTLTLAVAATVALGASAQAGMINTIIGNFDIAFDGSTGELTDFNRPDGGNLDATESRTVSSVEIEVDGITDVMLMNPPDALFADLKIGNLGAELATGALTNAPGVTGFGFDFHDPSGNKLRIDLEDISYTVVETGFPGLNFFSWFANGKVTDQSLPNGIAYSEDVLVSYTATEVMVLSGQTGVRTLVASGAMTITGNMVPEPTAAVLGLLASLGGCFRRRR